MLEACVYVSSQVVAVDSRNVTASDVRNKYLLGHDYAPGSCGLQGEVLDLYFFRWIFARKEPAGADLDLQKEDEVVRVRNTLGSASDYGPAYLWMH